MSPPAYEHAQIIASDAQGKWRRIGASYRRLRQIYVSLDLHNLEKLFQHTLPLGGYICLVLAFQRYLDPGIFGTQPQQSRTTFSKYLDLYLVATNVELGQSYLYRFLYGLGAELVFLSHVRASFLSRLGRPWSRLQRLPELSL